MHVKKRAASAGELILSAENWANDQILYFDTYKLYLKLLLKDSVALCYVHMGAWKCLTHASVS